METSCVLVSPGFRPVVWKLGASGFPSPKCRNSLSAMPRYASGTPDTILCLSLINHTFNFHYSNGSS